MGRPDPKLLATGFLLLFLAATTARGEHPPIFKRGDANGDARLDVSDPVFTLNYLFGGGRSGTCDDAADSNDDGAMDISDAVHSLVYLFVGGSEPPSPGMQCGSDPTADRLDCQQYLPCGHVDHGSELAILKAADGCDELLDELRVKLTENMEQRLEENIQYVLQFVEWGCPVFDDVVVFNPVAGGQQRAAGPDNGEAPAERTGTNNQIEGVDEADFLKNDGAHIYILAGGKFQIIDAWPAPSARKISTADVEGTPRKLFVHENRAVVYSSLESIRQVPGVPVDFFPGRFFDPGECTYGYDCDFTGDGRKLKVTIFDIEDRTGPRLLREIEVNGSYLGARRIGDRIYTVVVFPEIILPGISYWPKEFQNRWEFCWQRPFPFTEEEIRALFAALAEENRARIEAAELTDLLPSVTDTRHDGGEPQVTQRLLSDCGDFYISPSGDGQSFLSLVSFGSSDVGEIEATTILGKPGAIHASRDSLYIATRHYGHEMDRWYFPSREETPEATTIHKFRLFGDRPGSEYLGSGAVKGRVLNQFSMDEHEGYLRIATTTGHVPSPSVHSTISVLEEVSGSLDLVGQVDNIAPTEDIRAVRFDRHLGFVVTFKKTDPLFVLDLSAPAAPVIRSELKIPGFSTYIHLLDEEHLLSIGYDADDRGGFAYFQGILLQVFDVGDLDRPALLHREVIGTRGSTSDAATNHLAFTYFRSRGLLGVPMVVCESGGGGRHGDRISFNGLMVYRVDGGSGFHYLGGVPHEESASAGVSCGNWWTSSNSQVKRSIFMDDYVYSVALDRINISGLMDLEHPVASISLAE